MKRVTTAQPQFHFTSIERNYNVTYLGDDKFFVTVGKYNDLILRYNYLQDYFKASQSYEGKSPYLGPYDSEYNYIIDFNTWVDRTVGTKLKEFEFPIQATVTGPGEIYLKIPKLMAGSNNSANKQINYIDPEYIGGSPLNRLYVSLESQITKEIASINDALFIRSNDVFEGLNGIRENYGEFPIPDGATESYGNYYVKLAEVDIVDGVGQIKYFWTSNMLCPNRYASLNLTIWRGFTAYIGVLLKKHEGFFPATSAWEMTYSRPDWMLLTIKEIREKLSSPDSLGIKEGIQNWKFRVNQAFDESINYAETKICEVVGVYWKGHSTKPKLENFHFEPEEGYEHPVISQRLIDQHGNWLEPVGSISVL